MTIVGHGIDRYDRTLGDVIHDGKSLNLDLVTAGLAWHCKQYSDDEHLAAAELEARAAGKGLWSDPRHVAPWDWRKLSKIERDQLGSRVQVSVDGLATAGITATFSPTAVHWYRDHQMRVARQLFR